MIIMIIIYFQSARLLWIGSRSFYLCRLLRTWWEFAGSDLKRWAPAVIVSSASGRWRQGSLLDFGEVVGKGLRNMEVSWGFLKWDPENPWQNDVQIWMIWSIPIFRNMKMNLDTMNEWYGYGSIPINTIFRGMNIHLPAILMFARGTRFWHIAILKWWSLFSLQPLPGAPQV